MILSSTKWNVKDEILCGIKPYNKATIDRLLTAHVSKDPSDFKIKMGPRKRHYFLAKFVMTLHKWSKFFKQPMRRFYSAVLQANRQNQRDLEKGHAN